jgi:hypothetical protein
MHRGQLISRRGLLQAWALSFTVGTAKGERQDARPVSPFVADRIVTLVKEIKYAGFLDVSADSKKVCLYFSQNPARSFRSTNSHWAEKNAPVRDGEDALRIVSTDSWTPQYSTRLPALPYKASFFDDGEAVYIEIPGVAGGGTDRALADLASGRLVEHVDYPDAGYFFQYWALEDRALLGSSRNAKQNRAEFLIKAEAPDFKEIKRVRFAGARSRTDSGREAPIVVSSNRRAFAYAYDSTVVSRSARNLEELWSHVGDPEQPVWQVGISADGEMVAAAAADTLYIGASMKHYVTVFSGRDGRVLTTIPALATESVAISPDGKILAAGQRIPLHDKKTSGTQPTVVLFDIASGKNVGTIVHDQFYEGGGEYLHAGVKAAFTPDGKYLITSGLNTKIWQIANV